MGCWFYFSSAVQSDLLQIWSECAVVEPTVGKPEAHCLLMTHSHFCHFYQRYLLSFMVLFYRMRGFTVFNAPFPSSLWAWRREQDDWRVVVQRGERGGGGGQNVSAFYCPTLVLPAWLVAEVPWVLQISRCPLHVRTKSAWDLDFSYEWETNWMEEYLQYFNISSLGWEGTSFTGGTLKYKRRNACKQIRLD